MLRGEINEALRAFNGYGLPDQLPPDADADALVQLMARDKKAVDGLTFVLIITGKGKMGAESERGVLRRQVPQWLGLPEFRSLVVGFEEAHIGHGGEGALYVRVRRARL